MPCCECGEMMSEFATKSFFVCEGCQIKSDKVGLDGLWYEYLSFLFPCKPRAFGREKHYSAWQMGLLCSRETVEFLAFSFRNS
jgi:hypothetical protein